MAGTKFKGLNECLICVSNISTETIQVDKLDFHFLLRILLEIPQENKLIGSFNSSFNRILCDHCTNEIQECKQIYIEICERIERFWECQNKILEKFSADSNSSKTTNDNWIVQCRKFVKDHDFTGFGYPFVVHDLETLLISIPPPPHQLQDGAEANSSPSANNELTNSPENSNSLHLSKGPLDEVPSPFSQHSEQNESLAIKQEPESEDYASDIPEDEDYMLNEQDNMLSDSDSDYQPSPSKKSRNSPTKRNSTKQSPQIKKSINNSKNYPNFERDQLTGKFHCVWSADCDRKFADQEYMRVHWDRHEGTPRQKCGECSQSFYSRKELTGHNQREHAKDDEGKFDCEKCGKKCKTREALTSHLRNFHNKKEEEKRLARLKKKEEDPIKRDPESNKWRCWWPDCGKLYLRWDLTFHLDRHKGTPQQKCEECGELFYSRKQLVHHKQKVHGEDKKFKCEICGGQFKTSDGLRGHHQKYMHSEKGDRVEVVCEICGKTYKKSSMKWHMKYVHGEEGTGEVVRKFACHLCPGRFKDLRSLKRHLWRVHGFCESEKDREMFERYREKAKERGNNWTCHVKGCRQKYVTEEGLKKHLEGVHKGGKGEVEEWRFKCQVCGKGFHVRQKWTRHLKQHEK